MTLKRRKRIGTPCSWGLVAFSLALLLSGTTRLRAEDDVAGFYKGKTIHMMVGVGAGTGTDLIARMMARHLVNHIPGNPGIIAQNIPGAGSVQMANNLANSAARDGTVIGASINGLYQADLAGQYVPFQ
jgi:tripartite-type tricarboxylate transporter receptor subunit TctC